METQVKKTKYDKLLEKFEDLKIELQDLKLKSEKATGKQANKLIHQYETEISNFAKLTDKISELCQFSNYTLSAELQKRTDKELETLKEQNERELRIAINGIKNESDTKLAEEKQKLEKKIFRKNEYDKLLMLSALKKFVESQELIHLEIKKHTPKNKSEFDVYRDVISKLSIIPQIKNAVKQLQRFADNLVLKDKFISDIVKKYNNEINYSYFLEVPADVELTDDEKTLLQNYGIQISYTPNLKHLEQ